MIASRDANGSSSSRAGVPASRVRAKATRCRIPPESSRGYASAKSPRPSRSSIPLARRRPSRVSAPLSRSAMAALSTAVFQGSSSRSAASRCSLAVRPAADGSPPTAIVPAPSGISPPISSSSVDFPHPEGPTSATVSPPRDLEIEAVENLDVRRSCGETPVTRIAPAGTGSGAVRVASLAASGSLSAMAIFPSRALPHRFGGSAPGGESRRRYLSPLPASTP